MIYFWKCPVESRLVLQNPLVDTLIVPSPCSLKCQFPGCEGSISWNHQLYPTHTRSCPRVHSSSTDNAPASLVASLLSILFLHDAIRPMSLHFHVFAQPPPIRQNICAYDIGWYWWRLWRGGVRRWWTQRRYLRWIVFGRTTFCNVHSLRLCGKKRCCFLHIKRGGFRQISITVFHSLALTLKKASIGHMLHPLVSHSVILSRTMLSQKSSVGIIARWTSIYI